MHGPGWPFPGCPTCVQLGRERDHDLISPACHACAMFRPGLRSGAQEVPPSQHVPACQGTETSAYLRLPHPLCINHHNVHCAAPCRPPTLAGT